MITSWNDLKGWNLWNTGSFLASNDPVIGPRLVRPRIACKINSIQHLVGRLCFLGKMVRRQRLGRVEDQFGFHGTLLHTVEAVRRRIEMRTDDVGDDHQITV